jgi:hypothetical protein
MEFKWNTVENIPKDGSGFLAVPWTDNLQDVSWTWWIKEDSRWANWPWEGDPEYWAHLPEL